ncbi:MFS general substrate transporter [Dendrothele bispora CBS 962.96]|uniref:MFS general substrate transporter n=1 Tax=Dendrothele bispora (strain CBS 962.96) TaxID=1314807 RepID=A0A4S8KQ41_DENBC|nr:MFS general substrate transporter [Dendrothele bispora CBS 962.96]
MSRPPHGRTNSSTPPFPSGPENLILVDGAVSEEATELLHDFVHPHHHRAEETLTEPEVGFAPSNEFEARLLPWWKRPSPWWLICMLPLTSITMAATIAPKVEIYTLLACAQHKPEIFDSLGLSFADPGSKPNLCAVDPVVQAAVARLSATMALCMGILGCLTTGWWGSFSDRHGRTKIMGITVIGLIVTDAAFILVYFFQRQLPGGYWFLIIGPLLEGSLGGTTSAIAAMHAYMADTTTPATRSRALSLSLGFLFLGFSIGPTLGGILIRLTHKTISVFYVATVSHLIYACMIWFVVPESLSRTQMEVARAKYKRQVAEARMQEAQANRTTAWLIKMKGIFGFLTPLTIFAPTVVPNETSLLKKSSRDWNLTFIAIGYAFALSIMGSYTYKFQYAAATFNWTSETMGYLLTLAGASRALTLAVILPLAIKFFKAKPIPTRRGEEEPLLGRDNARRSRTRSHSPSRLTEPNSSSFDLKIARASLFVEVIAHGFMGFATNSVSFLLFGMLGSLGTGFSPAIQSVTVELYNRRGGTESGKLFGALSVVQALSSQIFSPAIYGLVYMKTVATFPRTIFFVSVTSVFLSLVFISLVRLPDANVSPPDAEADIDTNRSRHVLEDTLVDVGDGEGVSEGSSRLRKSHTPV